ncbi:hypothetical protein HPB52_001344 [Rhipicephalus sanguineus]|uniref:HTH psq-type domain-containing protein n=1 Tax=Rhipicephalus sanguineus TaxID=34632 RepID=A0A9D4QBU4_RHISA|nr:hypothetical protein HPB52_001344 [Rhipicephalus sanguineus]
MTLMEKLVLLENKQLKWRKSRPVSPASNPVCSWRTLKGRPAVDLDSPHASVHPSVIASRGTYRPPKDLKTKVEILREVENSVPSKTEITKKYDITKSTLSTYIKNRVYHRWI